MQQVKAAEPGAVAVKGELDAGAGVALDAVLVWALAWVLVVAPEQGLIRELAWMLVPALLVAWGDGGETVRACEKWGRPDTKHIDSGFTHA